MLSPHQSRHPLYWVQQWIAIDFEPLGELIWFDGACSMQSAGAVKISIGHKD
jgi:hypothetical protein